MNEESVSDVQTEFDDVTTEDNAKTEAEDMTEEIAPNESPPEQATTLNDDPKFTSAEVN